MVREQPNFLLIFRSEMAILSYAITRMWDGTEKTEGKNVHLTVKGNLKILEEVFTNIARKFLKVKAQPLNHKVVIDSRSFASRIALIFLFSNNYSM